MHVHTMRASVLMSSIQLLVVSLDVNTMLVSILIIGVHVCKDA